MRRSTLDRPVDTLAGTRPVLLQGKTYYLPDPHQVAICRYVVHLRNHLLMRFDEISDRVERHVAKRERRNPIPLRGKYVRAGTPGASKFRIRDSLRWKVYRLWTPKRCEEAWRFWPGIWREWLQARRYNRPLPVGRQLTVEELAELLAARRPRCECGERVSATSWGWYCRFCQRVVTPGR